MNNSKITINVIDALLEYGEATKIPISLTDGFKYLHDKYKKTYKELHEQFYKELDLRKDIYFMRTSDIFVRGVERKRMPIIHNQWVSHMSRF